MTEKEMTEKEMREAIARVRELHQPNEYDECEECGRISDWVNAEYPCRTIKALDGEQ